MAEESGSPQSIQDFLKPLSLDLPRICLLARKLADTYRRLAAESDNQFLSTPITETILKPLGKERGRYLAIDIGGTNLRAGFIDLSGKQITEEHIISKENAGIQALKGKPPLEARPLSRVNQTHKSWPIGEKLKQEKAADLFSWIGECIVEVIEDALKTDPGSLGEEVPMGVTFSFPMIQTTLNHAILMSMGKGFAITSNLNLGELLHEGYIKATRNRPHLPSIKVVAIVNDAVATLISFMYQLEASPHRKATMGLIVGTGTNATIPMKLSSLKRSKRPKLDHLTTSNAFQTSPVKSSEELKIVINTEWTISGAAPPLHELNIITAWDKTLDAESSAPGFQPFEYMTSGRYLGELARLIIVDYFTSFSHLNIPFSCLPSAFRTRNGLTTTFLGFVRPGTALQQLAAEFPPDEDGNGSGSDEPPWAWTEEAAQAVYHIGKAIEVRAAGMAAAAIIGLLTCAEELHLPPSPSSSSSAAMPNGILISTRPSHDETTNQHLSLPNHPSVNTTEIQELVVGYTGGCIVHFQDYLQDCQAYLDQILEVEFHNPSSNPERGSEGYRTPRVVLQPSHDGGIIGAGVLAGMVVGAEGLK